MNKSMVFVVSGILILALLGIFLLLNQKSNQNSSNSNEDINGLNNQTSMNIVNDETVAESDTSSSSSETSNPTIHKIEIKNFDFSPTELRIKVGDSVEWTNMDSVGHTVTSDSGKELDSSLLSKGKTYSHTFASTGTYEYHCSPHPYMKSKIIVE